MTGIIINKINNKIIESVVLSDKVKIFVCINSWGDCTQYWILGIPSELYQNHTNNSNSIGWPK